METPAVEAEDNKDSGQSSLQASFTFITQDKLHHPLKQ